VIIATPQPRPKSLAANGPGFPVITYREIGKCDTGGRVK
jgi:hypothetical protein